MKGETSGQVSGVVTGGELEQFEMHLQVRLRGQVRDFCLMAQEGGLVLHGYARAYYAKQRAQHLVMEMTGLSILANRIEVGSSLAERSSGTIRQAGNMEASQ